ncbi:FAD-dependent oxidoreductase [bacterium]|nr:FAD-dependent oxidoreductase [bacterium]
MDVVVIGGSAAGLKAACRISRLQPNTRIRVLVKDRYFAYSNCGLPYFLSGEIESFDSLISTPNNTIKNEKYFREVKGIEILPSHEVVDIDRAARLVRCVNIEQNTEATFPYDKLVISTGATPIIPAIPGYEAEGVYTFTKPEDAIKLRRELQSKEIDKVLIIGGGFIGLELCDAFTALWGVDVELVELQNQLLSGLLDIDLARLVETELTANGITLQLGCGCREIVMDSGRLCVFDHSGDMIQADRIILTTGVRPNSLLAKEAGLEIGVTSGIKVNDHLQTTDPDIYAAGDCVEIPNAVDGHAGVWPLGSLASRMGRVVGDNICDGDSGFGPVVGTMVLKMFDLTIGSVGLSRSDCVDKGYELGESWGTFHDRLNYYPDAVPLNAKLIYDKSNGKLLGFQAVSKGRIVHTLNLAAQIIRTGGTLDDLNDIEHAYAPPYALPFDPLHYLGYIAENSLTAGVKLISPMEFANLPDDTLILDVRIPSEIEGTPLNMGDRRMAAIPVEELRSRLNEITHNGQVVTVCQMGSRSWDAALMLRRAGFENVGILAGGALFLPQSLQN